MLTETAPAKINLALHVRGRAPNGYHYLETIYAFCEDGDVLALEPKVGPGFTMEVVGPFADGLAGEGDNLVLRAARALSEHVGISEGAHFTLDKRLPIASGIGGGSADAAAAMRLLLKHWRIEVSAAEMNAIAGRLGADIPACLASVTSRGLGFGEVLSFEDVPNLAGGPVLLVNPGIAVSTADVFRRWDGVDGGPLDGDISWDRNDLEPIARQVAPVIGDVVKAFGPWAYVARMSGSGATCFGLYVHDDDRDAAAARIAVEHPDWWLLPTRLRP